MKWIRAVAAAVAMVLVIGGAPVLLLGWGGFGQGWWRADDGSLFLTILTIAGWLAWLAFTLATVLEIVRYAGGSRFVPDLPLLGGLQALCAGLVLAVVAAAGWPGTTTEPQGGEAQPSVPQKATAASVLAERPSASPTPEPRSPAAPETVDAESYTVAAGDDLWSVAERLFGEGRRWRDLARANPDLLSDPTGQLTAGTRLKLPTRPAAAADQPKTVTVERGDTLSGLAKEHLGSTGRWPRIAAANEELISDPDHIEIGWKLVIPERSDRKGKASEAPGQAPDGGVGSGRSPDQQERVDHDQPGSDSSGPPGGEDEASQEVGAGEAAPERQLRPRHPASDPESHHGSAAPEEVESQPGQADATDAAQALDSTLIGSLGALVAAGLMGGWQARRLLQRRVRPPGRRVLHPDDGLTRLHAAVGRRRVPDHAAVLDAALRTIGRHCHQTGLALPELAQATLAPERISFSWASPAGPPPAGFDGDQSSWWVALPSEGSDPLRAVEHPCAYPALVSLGTNDAGETVLIDLERSGVVGIAAEQRELQLASLASIAVELACVPWAAELALVCVGMDAEVARVAGGEAVSWLRDADAALTQLRLHHARRHRELDGLELARLRTDPERADAVRPQIYVFHGPLSSAQHQEIDDLLAGSRLGIAAVVIAEAGADAQWELFGDPHRPHGRYAGGELNAHAIPESTRVAVTDWYRVAETTETEPAPWWSDSDATNLRLLPSRHPPREDPVDIVSLRRLVRPHPTLLLIGPIDLTSAAGQEPNRARYQLMELCSWLLEHPGRTATEMAAGLGIAETTRRSNLSRLRAWLGTDPEGEPYLPEAYSGRIRLHPDVTSDVMQLRLLTGPGVNRIGEEGLVAALDLIRGGMLADAAPSQWYWAEGLRSDVAATLRDAGLVLVDRALQRRELDLARWATERALMVAPQDELLMCARIRIEHAAGNRPGVERQVLRLTQQARALGVDLLPATVMLCQQVMEGRPRARRA
jgi:hypothetical protein